MKYSILILMILMSLYVTAQQKKLVIKDSLRIRSFSMYKNPTNKDEADAFLKTTIENELNSIVASYVNQPNNQQTWIKIKAAAEDLLYRYYSSGKLLGSQKEQAYFIKMGMETMTAADIANKKMVLIVGIANREPAEFHIITVVKNCL